MARKMIEVSFGGVSIGEETVSIGVTVDRSKLELDDAELTFCGRRIAGSLLKHRDGKGQKRIGGAGEDDEISATFDVKKIGVGPKTIGFRLQFNRDDVEDSEIASFAKKEGQLEIGKVNELPEVTRPPDAEGQQRLKGPDGKTYTDHPDTGVQPKAKRKPKKPAMASTSGKNVLED